VESARFNNYIPNWLKAGLRGHIPQAAELAHQTKHPAGSLWPGGCPQDPSCGEGACTLNDGFGAVTIGLGREIYTDTAFAMAASDLSHVVPKLARRSRSLVRARPVLLVLMCGPVPAQASSCLIATRKSAVC